MSGDRPTLRAIAREANVAISTVSKVLNRHTDVAPETREAIDRLLAERGYKRLPTGRRPGRRTQLVDLVINELDSAWAISILAGVRDVMEESGLSLVVSSVHNRQSSTRRWFDSFLARGSEGAILVLSELTDQQREALERRSVPLVLVDGVSPARPDVPSIVAANFQGGYAATQHLIELGHRRIAAIGGPRPMQCVRERIAGYHAAMAAAGLPVHPRWLRYSNFHHDGGLAATRALLALPEPPTAIFAGSDQQATGVYEAVRRAGGTVPDDLSVAGFDDLDFTQWLEPPLTTVRQPLYDMGALAARTLLRLMSGEHLKEPRVELPTELRVRGSTAPPADRDVSLSGYRARRPPRGAA